MKCPECGSKMELRTTYRKMYGSGEPRKFYACMRQNPRCRCTHGAHQDGKAFGTPGDLRTRRTRIAAHNVFDDYWKSNGLTRGDGYKLLSIIMELPIQKAHIGNFDYIQCQLMITKINELDGIPLPKDDKINEEPNFGEFIFDEVEQCEATADINNPILPLPLARKIKK